MLVVGQRSFQKAEDIPPQERGPFDWGRLEVSSTQGSWGFATLQHYDWRNRGDGLFDTMRSVHTGWTASVRNWNADHRFADEIVWMLVPELMSIVCKMKNLAH